MKYGKQYGGNVMAGEKLPEKLTAEHKYLGEMRKHMETGHSSESIAMDRTESDMLIKHRQKRNP